MQRIADTGAVPFLAVTSLPDNCGQALIITDTLSIVEYIPETFADHTNWPKARKLCAEMHSSLGALRHQCTKNIGPDLSHAEALM